ncbi:MAG: M23 family metallopeptidase [Deltaproteobacteria bacterium]|nr:M23 family metallopeptidase [Deltaproteobacteria bacterium]
MESKLNPVKFFFRLLVAALVCLVLVSVWFLWGRLEGEKPVIATEIPSFLNPSQEFILNLSDAKSGIRKVWVAIEQNGKETVLRDDLYPLKGSPDSAPVHSLSVSVKVDAKKLGITDGKAIFRVMVRDNSWRGWFHGNKTAIEKEIVIDTRPPEIVVMNRVHNLNQGGAGLVIYRLSEPCPVNGVMVGDIFYPGQAGYFSDPGIYLAFIALNHQQGPGTDLFIKAVDQAGNATRAGFPHHIKRKVFKKDTINLSDSFLNQKMPEFDVEIPPDSQKPMLAKFIMVNKELRESNYQKISSAVAASDSKLYWGGIFTRLPNSAPRAGFADHRTYMYEGKEVDQQDHLGVDLASLQHSPVPAANSGRVVFVDFVGIYGKTVLLDHGFGLFSMYSHLSSFNVKAGQMVSKNDILGYTGSTGMAAGDHLHFSTLVRNTFVNPIEWWDEGWIKNNISDKIKEVQSTIK